MLAWFHRRINSLTTWRSFTLVFVGVFLCLVGFSLRQGRLDPAQQLALDARGWYTPDEAHAYLAHLDRVGGRHLYALTQLSLDLIFPILYGLLLAILLVRVHPTCSPRLMILPLLAVAFDVAENVMTATLALTYPDEPAALAWAAAVATALKFAFLVLSVLAVAWGAVRNPPHSATP